MSLWNNIYYIFIIKKLKIKMPERFDLIDLSLKINIKRNMLSLYTYSFTFANYWVRQKIFLNYRYLEVDIRVFNITI